MPGDILDVDLRRMLDLFSINDHDMALHPLAKAAGQVKQKG